MFGKRSVEVQPERLKCLPGKARARRGEVIRQHLAVQGSQTRLRARVKEMLGELKESEVSSEGMAAVVARVDELLEVDPTDTRHMFWEEMKRLFFAMRSSLAILAAGLAGKIGHRCRPLMRRTT